LRITDCEKMSPQTSLPSSLAVTIAPLDDCAA